MAAHLVAEVAHHDIACFLRTTDMPPEGIVAASDVIAMSTLRALAEAGRQAPGDVRLIGYDGLAIGEHTVPRLTTIAQDLRRGADTLVDLLLHRIAGEDPASVVMAPKLVMQMST